MGSLALAGKEAGVSAKWLMRRWRMLVARYSAPFDTAYGLLRMLESRRPS